MNARWLSRGLVVSVALLTSISAVGCAHPPDAGSDGAQKPVAAHTEEASARGQVTPGHRLFRQIEALDLTVDQREELRGIEDRLTEELSVHRVTVRRVAATLVRGVETGALDTAEASRDQEALAAAVVEAKASMVTAMNEVHGLLEADQREALVRALRAEHERRAQAGAEGSREGPQSFGAKLGLNEDQKRLIHAEIQAQMDRIVPDRKAKREAWEAKMQALGDAFMSDDFDAADFDLGSGAEEAIASFTTTAQRAIDISGRVLEPSQRLMLASMLRARAAEM